MKTLIYKLLFWGIILMVISSFKISDWTVKDSVHLFSKEKNSKIFPFDSLIRTDAAMLITKKMIKERLASLNPQIKLDYHKNIKGFINYYVNRNTAYTAVMLSRAKVYFPLFEKYLKEYGLPDELKYLSIVESGLNPTAISRVGATGLWQFMPSTGRLYNLKRDLYFDDKMNPEKSTIAACKYLKDLYNMFHDWPLALSAYNSGPGNVRKAIRRSGYKKTFWEIYRKLPRETKSYVPQFIAVMYAVNYAKEHQIYEIDSVEQATFVPDTVNIKGFLDLQKLSKILDIDLEKLSSLNPDLLRSAVPDYRKEYALLLPPLEAEFLKNRKDYLLNLASEKSEKEIVFKKKHLGMGTYGKEIIYYRVRRGDVLGTIARRFRVRVSNIRTWNRIRGNLIRVNQKLKLYVSPLRKKQYNLAKNKVKNKKPANHIVKLAPSRLSNSNSNSNSSTSKLYAVKSGDTLWKISKTYDIPVNKIKLLNSLNSNNIKPGDVLKLE